MTDVIGRSRWGSVQRGLLVSVLCGTAVCASAQALRPTAQLQRSAPAAQPETRTVDYIVALVNSEPVTNFDVRQRLLRVEQQLALKGFALPPREELLTEILEQLIIERAQLQQATDMGMRVDEATLLQAEQNVAAQNQLDLDGFRRRVAAEGLDINRLRNELRNQILLQRLRERELESRVRVSEADIDNYLTERRSSSAEVQEMNLGHVLIQVPEGASPERLSELELRAQGVAERLRKGADLAVEARSYSEAPEAASGGLLGLRPVGRLPELFVNATRSVAEGGVAGPVRSPAGFHVLKVMEKRTADLPELAATQSRARHILLRPGPQLSQADALARLGQYRQEIASGQASFESLARQHSQDGSAREGGDLGWVGAGQFVPEFEQAMDALSPGEMSLPLVSRFGVHLIRLEERRRVTLGEREQRDVVRQLLRDRKAEAALQAWSEEVRGQAFVEQREAPSL